MSQTKNSDKTEVAFTLPGGSKGTPNVIGFWSPDGGTDKDGKRNILFSRPFRVNGVVDVGMITELSYSLANGIPSQILAKTGGGEAGGSWVATLKFDTRSGEVTVIESKTYVNEDLQDK